MQHNYHLEKSQSPEKNLEMVAMDISDPQIQWRNQQQPQGYKTHQVTKKTRNTT